LKDLTATAQVLSRFGPKLPQLAEAALRQQMSDNQEAPQSKKNSATLFFSAGVLVSVGVWCVTMLF